VNRSAVAAAVEVAGGWLVEQGLTSRVPPGPYKSLKVLKFHTFKYKALKSP